MALTSRLAAAEDGLLAAINTRAAIALNPLEGVAIRLGDPGSGARPEHVWIIEEATAEQTSDLSTADAGAGREELFELSVRVLATRSGEDYPGLRDRSTAMGAEVEIAVAADRTLGGAVEDCEVVRLERSTGATEVGRAILLTVVVRARAWLA